MLNKSSIFIIDEYLNFQLLREAIKKSSTTYDQAFTPLPFDGLAISGGSFFAASKYEDILCLLCGNQYPYEEIYTNQCKPMVHGNQFIIHFSEQQPGTEHPRDGAPARVSDPAACFGQILIRIRFM